MPDCPFCTRLAAGTAAPANAHAAAISDGFPLTPGHTLIVSRRHVARYLDLSAEERAAIWQMVPAVWERVRQAHDPAGFNLGLNDGTAAGQTVAHVHLHVIPRYEGDVPDPRGGIRWVIPDRAPYWERRHDVD